MVGYASKVLADPPQKRMHPFVQFLLIEALGLKMQLVQDDELFNRLKGQFSRRVKRKPVRDTARIIHITRDQLRMRGIAGGRARWRGLSPEQKSDIARRAAQARWGREQRAQSVL